MRSLVPLPATWARRGLAAIGVAMLALTTGCDFILGVPSVTRVDVALSPSDTLKAQTAGQATATVFDGSKIITNNTKITVGYASSNSAIATVNPSTGVITAIAPGTTIISATAHGKKGERTLTVTPEPVKNVVVTPPTLFLNGHVQLVITALGVNGNNLGARQATVASGNSNVVVVERTDTTTNGVFLRAVNVGATVITGTVEGVPFSVPVTVQPPQVGCVKGALQKGSNTLLETESNQIAVQLFAADCTTPVPTAGQTISFVSNDQTVATVNPQTGVVTGVRQGGTTVDISVVGTTAKGGVPITVLPIPAVEIKFGIRAPFIRLGSNGLGVPSSRVAVPADSLGRQITNRTVSYRSTDPSVFTVSSLGTVVGQKLGTALLIASADNGKVADTLNLTVTPVPITGIRVSPQSVNISAGQTQQFTATLTDSLGVTVTGRTVTWQSSNPVAIPIDATGKATGVSNAGGTATITAVTDVVPGQPAQIAGQASILVTPTPIATIDVQPITVNISLRTANGTTISVIPRDAAGNALIGRTGSIVPTSDNPAVANSDASGNVRAFTQGVAHITFQAYDLNQQPQGAPTDEEEQAREARNADDLARLVAALGAAHTPFVRIDGTAPDGSYREPCVAVLLPRDEALALASRFEQLALFWYDGDGFWLLPAEAGAPPLELPSRRDAATGSDREASGPGSQS